MIEYYSTISLLYTLRCISLKFLFIVNYIIMATFADDTAIMVSRKDATTASEKLQNNVTKCNSEVVKEMADKNKFDACTIKFETKHLSVCNIKQFSNCHRRKMLNISTCALSYVTETQQKTKNSAYLYTYVLVYRKEITHIPGKSSSIWVFWNQSGRIIFMYNIMYSSIEILQLFQKMTIRTVVFAEIILIF